MDGRNRAQISSSYFYRNHIEELLDGVTENSRYYGYFISDKAIFTIDGIYQKGRI